MATIDEDRSLEQLFFTTSLSCDAARNRRCNQVKKRERKRMAKKLLRKALDSRDVKLNNLWIPGFSQKVGLLLQVM